MTTLKGLHPHLKGQGNPIWGSQGPSHHPFRACLHHHLVKNCKVSSTSGTQPQDLELASFLLFFFLLRKKSYLRERGFGRIGGHFSLFNQKWIVLNVDRKQRFFKKIFSLIVCQNDNNTKPINMRRGGRERLCQVLHHAAVVFFSSLGPL